MITPRTLRLLMVAAVAFAPCSLIGCTNGPSETSSWSTTRRTSGDTTIVTTAGAAAGAALRTLVREISFGQMDGEAELLFSGVKQLRVASNGNLWVFDSYLRLYDSVGRFIRRVGRQGDGPGEYRDATGFVLLRNGNAALWDGDNSLVHLYGPEGADVADWRMPVAHGAGLLDFMHNTLMYDTAGFLYLRGRTGPGPRGLIRVGPDGAVVDTIRPYTFGLKAPVASASRGGGGTSARIDHLPEEMWTWSPLGYFVVARSDQYALHLLHSGGRVTRIERDVEPVPLDPREWEAEIEGIAFVMRRYEPNWQWNGLVPTARPYFHSISVADDGLLWVRVTVPEEPIPEAERPTQAPAAGGAPVPYGPTTREPVVYDIYAPSGEFLGRVPMPNQARLLTTRGNHMWATMSDENDVPTIVRFRIEPPLVGASSRPGR